MRNNQCTARPGGVIGRFYKSILVVALGCGLLMPGPALAGQIFGQVLVNGANARAGLLVLVICAGERNSNQTDRFGSYQVYVRTEGDRIFRTIYKGAELVHPVRS
jgi:hypothetical protein